MLIYKCLGIKKSHSIVLAIGSEMKEKTAIHTFCGWFGSLFQRSLIENLIETILKQLSDENHLDLIPVISFFLSLSYNNTLHPPPGDWLGDLLKYDPVRHVYVENLLNTCVESIVLMALQILPQRNENGAALRSNLCCTRQLLSRSTSHLIRKGQIIHWMSGCRTA